MHLLFVCAGNVCRSPMAEGLVSSWAEQEARSGRPVELVVTSAGIEAAAGCGMDAKSAHELRRLGGRPPASKAKALTADLAAAANIAFTMTRRHRRAVLAVSPRGLQRTFTLREAAALLRGADLSGLHDVPFEWRAVELGRRLHAQRRFRASQASDDIEDPMGKRASVHARVADEIADSLRLLTGALLGWHSTPTSPRPAPRRRPGVLSP